MLIMTYSRKVADAERIGKRGINGNEGYLQIFHIVLGVGVNLSNKTSLHHTIFHHVELKGCRGEPKLEISYSQCHHS